MQVETLSPMEQQAPYIRVVDPRHFNADPDSSFSPECGPGSKSTFLL